MKYSRKDNQTNRIFFLFVIIIGLVVICLGLNKLHWAWNLLTFPLGLLTMIMGYKNFKRTNNELLELEFGDEEIRLRFINGKEKIVSHQNLSYSLLIKKFHKPIRSIELLEKRSIGLFRGKTLGLVDFSKWEKDIEPIAKHLVKSGYERKEWRFGWSFGDFLLIFSILIGATEGFAETYVGNLGLNVSESVGEIGTLFSEQKGTCKSDKRD